MASTPETEKSATESESSEATKQLAADKYLRVMPDKHELDVAYARWEKSGVPRRHRDTLSSAKFFEDENCRKAFEKALLAVDSGECVILLGDRGNGKTQCAVELLRHAVKSGMSVRYTRCREMVMEIREGFGANAKTTERKLLNSYAVPGVLVIDECQEKFDTDYAMRTMTMLLDKRYGDKKSTILVANQKPDKLGEILSDSVLDRLNEGLGYIQFTWPSFRG